MTKKIKTIKKQYGILTIRIEQDLDQIIDKICEERGITKAKLLREYIGMARYLKMGLKSFKSLNNNDLIMLKQNFLTDIIQELDEIKQIEIGMELAQYINDIARLQGRLDDINYKLDLCERYGFFIKFIDKENYIQFSKKFGPKKFVEAFVWQLITKGDQGDFDKDFIDAEMENNKKLTTKYLTTIQPIERDASHYSFEFAKMKK